MRGRVPYIDWRVLLALLAWVGLVALACWAYVEIMSNNIALSQMENYRYGR